MVDCGDLWRPPKVRLELACNLTVVGIYTPNSGQRLARLDYRVNVWDKEFRSYLRSLDTQAECNLGVVVCGDLNVAHQDIDIWNAGASHIQKSAGTTREERESFGAMLKELDMIDAFRWMNPANQVYTYWSRRAKNRPPNKGLRLDYFLCSRRLFNQSSEAFVRNSWVLNSFGGSDHCPISCVLSLPTGSKEATAKRVIACPACIRFSFLSKGATGV
ncbi:unnamed protein product [Durusdinium trenchii]|uniref:Chloroplastic (Apurinic endonuclease-redox protein) n=2 Tax=Durusdinium trenchii TaxID=1381693 RepID=A0ABP0JKD7_9DINO